MGFAPEYATYVLNENVEDAKAQFLAPLMAVHYAHLVMLVARRIVFRTAHRIAGAMMLGTLVDFTAGELENILGPMHVVDVRRTLGGPAPEETRRAAGAPRASLAADQEWLTRAKGVLEEAERTLDARSAAL